MTKLRFPVLILTILIAAALCACGDTTAVSSAPEGIETFGFEINPSAQPSVGQTVPGVDNPPPQLSQQPPVNSSGPVIEGDAPTSIRPSDNPPAAPTSSGGGTTPVSPQIPPRVSSDPDPVPSTSPDTPPESSTSPSAEPQVSPAPSGSDEPVTSPAISPPAPVSSATIDDAMSYVGKPLSSLIADLGYPYSSDYEDVVEGDPDTDRVGTLYFNGFIVTTLRTQDGETVTSVVPN